MIDLSNITKAENTTIVSPSDNIFEELGKNTYDYKDIISELIDNSLAARLNDRQLNVSIDLFVNEKGEPVEFCIKDNAKGISSEILGLAITPAGIKTVDSLNEHGLGMKQSIAALGKLKYLATKTQSEDKARVVLEFKFGELETYLGDFDSDSGTEIYVTNLRPIVTAHPTTITRSIIPYLGARYRKFLKPENKILNLLLSIKRIGSNDVLYNWNVDEIKPVYFHPSTRSNKPVIMNFKLENEKWKAELTFGYAPKDDNEYKELGVQAPNKFHPYYVSLSRQGLDVILHDRVILFHQLSELGIVTNRHNDFNSIRGEINLLSGFSTAITKNSIINDQNFRECIQLIKDILRGESEGPGGQTKDYLKMKTYPEAIPESLLRDRLQNWLSTNPLQKRKIVNTEYVIEGIEGYIDILADSEAWEVKVDQANALDVYQLFMYMDVGKIKKGFLAAKSFSTGAQVASRFILDNHKVEIVLSKLDAFPINHPPSETEREEYY